MPRRLATSFSIASRFGRFCSSPFAASAPPVAGEHRHDRACGEPPSRHEIASSKLLSSAKSCEQYETKPKSSMRAAGAGARRRRAPPRRSPSRRGAPRPAARSRGRGPSRAFHGRGRTVEAVEHPRPVGLGDPRAVVANADLAVAHPDLDRLAGRAPASSVVEQVRDGAIESIRAALDRRSPPRRARSGRPARGAAHARRRRRRAGRAARPRAPPAARRRGRARRDRRRGRSAPRPARRPSRSQRPGRFGFQPPGREQLDVRAQARQRRPQLVRRVRDELPLRGRATARAPRASG